MRLIARQGARLASHSRAASCSRIRQHSVPKVAVPPQTRAFSCSVKRPSDVRPPNGQGDQDARIEQQREEQKKDDPGATKAEPSNDTENGETKTNGDGRKPGMRRTLRNRRATEVPKPPPIPQWFLKHNVTLVKGMAPESAVKEGYEIVRCVDTETGHTLFTVPYYGGEAARLSGHRTMATLRGKEVDITALGMDGNWLSSIQDVMREGFIIAELVAQRSQPPEAVDLEALGELLVALPREVQETVLRVERANRNIRERQRKGIEPGPRDISGDEAKARDTGMFAIDASQPASNSVAQNFFDQKVPLRRSVPTPAFGKASAKSQGQGKAGRSSERFHPLAYVFLEAEASARASLSMAGEAQHSSSFASNRVDLSLYCPDSDFHDQMDQYVNELAQTLHADIIRLDANDFEDLTAEYVGQGQDSPGSFSTLGYDVFDGYEASTLGRSMKGFGSSADDADEFDVDEEEYDEDEEDVEERPSGGFGSMDDLRKALHERRHELGKALQGIGIAGITIGTPKIIHAGSGGPLMAPRSKSSSSSSDFIQWDDARLGALLESILDAAKQKRADPTDFANHKDFQQLPGSADPQARLARTAQLLVSYLGKNAEAEKAAIRLDFDKEQSMTPDSSPTSQRTIVHVRDLKDICRSRLGDAVIRKLVRVVQKRRRSGESVLIVGTTAQASNSIFMSSPRDAEDFPFRTITVPPLFKGALPEVEGIAASGNAELHKTLKQPAYNRILEINLRHVQSMLRRLRPAYDSDLLSHEARQQMALHGTHVLTEKVLSLDEVQRIVLVALGLEQSYAKSDTVQPVHIALATYITNRVNETVQQWASNDRMAKLGKTLKPGPKGKDGSGQSESGSSKSRVEEVKGSCNPHETRLLTGVVDSNNIKVGFGDVHAPTETIDALKTLTSLSLLRPEAFKYGVLANDRLPGLLLYGPPGTGKTLLAKAVAKESKATVLEVSGAQIYEKYVGEGEKMVRAVFSLAKKLSPCVVFIDEADAIFGSRSGSGNRNTHREIINQFLREWDGMDDHSVFMMVATNRPFDLDDAVLRRLPRRLLVDLPVAKDRQSILSIHLKNEILDPSVSLPTLAEQTPLYSGSDLKNLCVASALACVREENELAIKHKDDKEFKLPERRTLMPKHFEKAIAEISASISEDMSSLTAIRKFDEQYGDRRGRRKKAGYGFGAADRVVDESAARVRQAESQAPPPPPQ